MLRSSLRSSTRTRFVRVLYAIGEACFLVADRYSPSTDEIWRDRRWKQYLRNEARLDSYCISDMPEGRGYADED